MLKKLFIFIKTPTSIQIIVNTFGNYLNIGFTAFFAFLLVRIMNPVDYGILSILLGIAYVLANILDFGVSASIYSFLPEMIGKKTNRIFSFLKTTFFYQSLFASGVVLILIITFPYLDKTFFKTQALLWELYLTTISVLFFIWQNFAINSLIAVKKVFQANLFLNLSNLLKTIFIFILIFTHKINIATLIFSFGVLGPVIFFIFLFFEKKDVFIKIIKAEVRKNEFKFSYNFTYFFASQFFNLGTRMDLFLLSYYFPRSEILGYYGLSSKIILTLFASVASITQVLSPHFSQLKNYIEFKSLLKKSFFYLLVPTSLFFILAITPKEIFQIAFTKKFSQTTEIAHALALAYLIYPLLNIPFLFFLYTIKKPKYILISNIIFFIFTTVLCFLLIPKYHAFAGPISIFISCLISGLYLTLEFLKKLKYL